MPVYLHLNVLCTLVCTFNNNGVYIKLSLTNSKLKGLHRKIYDKAFEVSDRDSLGIRVSKKGKIAWQYRFRYKGKPDRLPLGCYPEVSLADARKLVPKIRGWLDSGLNPKVQDKIEKSKQTNSVKTLVEIADIWFNKVAKVDYKLTTQNNYESTLGKWVFNSPKNNDLECKFVKQKLDIPFDEISNAQWMDYFDWITSEGSAKTAGSVFKLIKTIVTWALKRELITNSNLLLFKVNDVGMSPNIGERTPNLSEIARMWVEIDKSKALPQTKACLKLIILLGARNTAIRAAKWEHFDFDRMIWKIPVPKGKKQAKRRGTHEEDNAIQKPESHPIPLKVKELLDELALIYGKTGYVFNGERSNQPITIHAVNRFCNRISTKLFTKYGISKITPHDFRRSLESTICEIDVKYLPICEKILGHKLRGTMAHYNKADYIKQQLEVYELYWKLIKQEIEAINSV